MKMSISKPDNQRLITLILGAIAVIFFILAILFIILFATKHCKKCDCSNEVQPNQDNSNAYLAQLQTTSSMDDSTIISTVPKICSFYF